MSCRHGPERKTSKRKEKVGLGVGKEGGQQKKKRRVEEEEQ